LYRILDFILKIKNKSFLGLRHNIFFLFKYLKLNINNGDDSKIYKTNWCMFKNNFPIITLLFLSLSKLGTDLNASKHMNTHSVGYRGCNSEPLVQGRQTWGKHWNIAGWDQEHSGEANTFMMGQLMIRWLHGDTHNKDNRILYWVSVSNKRHAMPGLDRECWCNFVINQMPKHNKQIVKVYILSINWARSVYNHHQGNGPEQNWRPLGWDNCNQ